MPFFDSIRIGASQVVDTGFSVDRSLRFNSGDSAKLTRTFGTNTSNTTKTISFWVKRATLGSYQSIFATTSSGYIEGRLQFDNDDRLRVTDRDSGSGSSDINKVTDRKFRDIGAWYHIVIAYDTTNGTAGDRVKVYVNGSQVTVFSTDTNPASSYAVSFFRSSVDNFIGANNTSDFFDGYLAEINFIDGQALTPTSFGETDSTTGQWNPIDTSGLTFGNNGFRMKFDDNSGTSATTLGKDSSGNSNNFTPSNFSVSAGSGNDSLEDTPTNNFCTINPLVGRGTVFLTPTNGNLDFSLPSGSGYLANASFLIPTSGKWYAEYVFTTVGSGVVNVGNNQKSEGSSAADQLNGISMLSGEIRVNDSSTQTSLTAFGNNDIIGVKVDRDAGTVAFTINGSAVGNAENISSMLEPTDLIFRAYRNASGGSTPVGSINFGQRPFSYQPSGFKALNSQNLPDPTILLPNENFDTLLFTANASTQVVTGLNFSPDWVWGKSRDDSYDHELYDTVRGPLGRLKSNATDQELTNSQNLQSFNSDGFTLGSATNMNYNSGSDIVAWNWNAGDTDGKTYTVTVVSDSGNKFRFDGYGTSAVTLDLAEGGTYVFNYPSGHPFRFSTTSDGTHGGGSEYTTGVTHNSSTQVTIVVAASAPTLYYYCSSHSGMGGQVNTNSTLGSSNFDGTIQSVTKVNASAGFSITKYTGTGSSSTVGHGLGVKPDAIIIKCRSNTDNWMVYHNQQNSGVDPEDYYAELNSTSINVNSTAMLNDTAPTSTSVTIGSDNSVNGSGRTYVMYCFSSVNGFSKFGRYYGNFNANGTFIYTGFKPAWLMVKQFGSDNWYMVDNKRDPFNVMDHRLFADVNSAEGGIGQEHVDFLSNGFKYRRAKTPFNNTFNYIYFCFAESPFKNARAR